MSHMKRLITIILIALLLSLAQEKGHAEDAYDIHGDLIAFTSLPAQGKIDQVTMSSEGLIKTISINDTNYTFDADAIFRDANGAITPQASLKEGMYVEFYYLEKTTTITKIWISTAELAEEHSRDESSLVSETDTGSAKTAAPAEPPDQQPASQPAREDEVILKDGVWQN